MFGFYLFAAILGGGLLVFSLVGGDGTDHDAIGGHHGVDELLLGFFRPRNLIFFLAAFGVTGTLLTWLNRPGIVVALFAAVMGLGAMTLSHALFTWLGRSDSAQNVLSDIDLEGLAGKVVLSIAPGEAGRVVCEIGGREQYLTARLADGTSATLETGREVVIVRVANGVAEVSAFDSLSGPKSAEMLPPPS
jgi:hypothetical protein